METLDSTALAPALPTIAREFDEPTLHLSLALSSYLVTLAVLIPASGWAADRFGPRRVFVTAVGLFVLGSVLCSVSWDLASLVGARIVQGMGGAMMSPVGRFALLRATRKDEMLRMMSWVRALVWVIQQGICCGCIATLPMKLNTGIDPSGEPAGCAPACRAAVVAATPSPGCSRHLEKSIVRPSRRGGVPVFKRPCGNFNSLSRALSDTAGGSPARPAA
jgi:hypothetical protein